MTPSDFNQCVTDGGKVRTMPVKGGRYMRICFSKDGKSHAGEVRMKKDMQKQSKEMMS